MLIYIEKKVLDNPITIHILSKYNNPTTLPIDNYKNIFDKNISWTTEKMIVIAAVNNAITATPPNYGEKELWFFFKNSLNCIYDCSYCYLKWAFKNDMQVFFVNYDDIKNQIREVVKVNKTAKEILFYSSDYSDNLATDNLTLFTKEFIPLFEEFENAIMEIRTKSTNINSLLEFQTIPKNTEIAFSLNPNEVIEKYEKKTPLLDMRIWAIKTLLEKGWKVGIRFQPLLEIENYKEIYERFIEKVLTEIDFSKVHSVFIGTLLYTHEDYNKMLKKEKDFDLLYKLEKNDDGYFRENKNVRNWFYQIFQEKLLKKEYNICLDPE